MKKKHAHTHTRTTFELPGYLVLYRRGTGHGGSVKGTLGWFFNRTEKGIDFDRYMVGDQDEEKLRVPLSLITSGMVKGPPISV